MQPAFSIIFFTAAAGAGYGLLMSFAVVAIVGWLPLGRGLGLAALGLALVLVCGGLTSSTFHLGHPARAWRAFSQWRTSWLSREGVLAVLSFVPALVIFSGYLRGADHAPTVLPAFAMLALSASTVFATAMIYASLNPIPAWCNPWVPANYLLLAALSGLLLMNALARGHGAAGVELGMLVLAAIVLAALAKLAYWDHIDATPLGSSRESATGLGHLGQVRLLDPPHTEANFVQKEMGYRIARKHAKRLRRIVLVAAFGLPFTLTALNLMLASTVATVCAVLAAVAGMFGVLIERWLFFAEARHVVTLYY